MQQKVRPDKAKSLVISRLFDLMLTLNTPDDVYAARKYEEKQGHLTWGRRAWMEKVLARGFAIITEIPRKNSIL